MMILDMKQRVLLTIILLMVFCSYSFAGTPKAYCVYVENTKTVTIYYDDQMDSRPGTEKCVIVNMGNMSNGPSSLKNKDKVENAVINPSFKDSGYTSTTGWFAYMTNLKTIEGLQNIDFSKIRFAASMFGQCESLESIDLSSYEMPALEHAESMFMNCFKLKSVKLFKTSSNLRFVQNMFNHCNSLTSIDLTPLVTSGVESMSYMFEWCINLTSLDLSKFNTSSMTSMMGAFSYCYSLEHLDLSSFNTSKVTMMQNLFENSNLLNTIYVGNGWSTEKVTNSDKMFSGCEKLIGGAGTKYDPNHIDGTYAHIDGGSSKPGYLSPKVYDVWVAGKQVNIINMSDVLGDGGSVKYTESIFGKYLTLENANIKNTSENGQGIYTELPNLNIRVKGNNTIESNGEGIYFTGNLRILSGTDNQDKLNVKGSFGIRPTHNTEKTLTIGGVDLTAEGTSGAGIGASASFSSGNYNCTMKVGSAKTVVKAKGTSVSLGNLKSLVFEDGLQIVQPSGAYFDGEDVRNTSGIISNQWVVIKYNPSIATGLEAIDNGELTIDSSLPLYNLHGQRVSHPVKGQIYIQNGRKIKF